LTLRIRSEFVLSPIALLRVAKLPTFIIFDPISGNLATFAETMLEAGRIVTHGELFLAFVKIAIA
jgi:hypothetical protein